MNVSLVVHRLLPRLALIVFEEDLFTGDLDEIIDSGPWVTSLDVFRSVAVQF